MTPSPSTNQDSTATAPLFSFVCEQLERLNTSNGKTQLLQTGLPGFDQKFGGLARGEFVVLGGRPGMGKTQVLIEIAQHLSQQVPVLFFTYDLSALHLSQRFISSLCGVAVQQIINGQLSVAQRTLINEEAQALSQRQLLLNETFYPSLSAFKDCCRQHVAADGIQVVFIDYLQLLSDRTIRQNRDAEISYITRELKTFAKELQICIIASSQLSRSLELRGGDRRPMLSDLRESGAIEQDADKVLFIYRPEYYGFMQDENGQSTIGLVELILAKNRTGYLGTVQFLRNATHSAYLPLPQQQLNFNFSTNRLDELNTPTEPSPPF